MVTIGDIKKKSETFPINIERTESEEIIMRVLERLARREFDSSFFGVLMQILYLSHLRLIFLSNFVIFIVLLCTLCGIIKKTDFIIGEKRYVYIYHWK